MEGKQDTVTLSDKYQQGQSIRVPITLTWEDIGFAVKVPQRKCPPRGPKTKKTILQNVSGVVKPGQMLAIIGSTGAGKSSLLDVLAQRYISNFYQGNFNHFNNKIKKENQQEK